MGVFDGSMENEELRLLQKEQSVIFDSIPSWIFFKDRDNKFISVNRALCEAMGKSKEEFEGKSLFDIYPKEQAEGFWGDDKKVIDSGEPKRNIIESVNTASGLRWVKTDKIPYRDEEGKIVGIIGFSIDITDEKELEDKNQRSQVMLQKIIDLLPIRIFWKDSNLNYLGCNKVFAEDAGKTSAEEVAGRDDYQMGWKEQADLYRKDDMAVITTNTPKVNYEEAQTTPSGDTIWLNTNKVPLMGDDGKIIGVLGTYFDITDKKLAEDKLKDALEETQKINSLMVGRELKMAEMKDKIKKLESR